MQNWQLPAGFDGFGTRQVCLYIGNHEQERRRSWLTMTAVAADVTAVSGDSS